jgi:hypothetical protein
MGTFFEDSVSRLQVGQSTRYAHRFGGEPKHEGCVPPGEEHATHLLLDLDLSDPQLGLASRFPNLTRLPLYNALQYNCCDMIYRVVVDDVIEILAWDTRNALWDKNFPFNNYPQFLPRTLMVAVPVEPQLLDLLNSGIGPDGDENSDFMYHQSANIQKLGYPFPQVGGRQSMWQGIPEWKCGGKQCRSSKRDTNEDKEVFAVMWELPVPGVNLWSDDAENRYQGSVQIIFSRCIGCGVIHSCNRCD